MMSPQNSAIDSLQAEISKTWDPLNRRIEKIASRDDGYEQEIISYIRSAAQILVIRLNETFDVYVGDRRLVPADDKSFVEFKIKQIASRRYQFQDLDLTVGFGHDFIEIDGFRHPKEQIESALSKLNTVIIGHFSPDKASGVFVRRNGIMSL